MEKALKALLDELEENDEEVQAPDGGQATITPDIEDPNTTKVLDSSACRKVLQSEATVQELFRALGCPDNASIELEGVEVSCKVSDALEELFVDVVSN